MGAWLSGSKTVLVPASRTKLVCPVQAPGYFTVIQNPMDFKTMRQKLTRGEYQSWDALQVGFAGAH